MTDNLKSRLTSKKVLLPTAIAAALVAGAFVLGTNHNNAQIEACNTGNDDEACEYVLSLNPKDHYKSKIDTKVLARRDERIAAAAEKEREAKAKKVARLAAIEADTKKRNAKILADQKAAAAERAAAGKWSYNTYTDDATGRPSKTASLTSENSMQFDFPYGGIQYGRFTVRNHPRHGVDAYLKIDKGQLLCNSYNNPTVLIRFDNGAASSYGCTSAADHSSDIVFIESVARLEDRMRTAQKMYLTVSVYGEGSRTWEFDVKGYNKNKI